MDPVALHILCRELEDDARVLHEAAATARKRLDDPHPGHLEACGFEINRVYNVIEKAFERVCVAFSGRFLHRSASETARPSNPFPPARSAAAFCLESLPVASIFLFPRENGA